MPSSWEIQDWSSLEEAGCALQQKVLGRGRPMASVNAIAVRIDRIRNGQLPNRTVITLTTRALPRKLGNSWCFLGETGAQRGASLGHQRDPLCATLSMRLRPESALVEKTACVSCDWTRNRARSCRGRWLQAAQRTRMSQFSGGRRGGVRGRWKTLMMRIEGVEGDENDRSAGGAGGTGGARKEREEYTSMITGNPVNKKKSRTRCHTSLSWCKQCVKGGGTEVDCKDRSGQNDTFQKTICFQ